MLEPVDVRRVYGTLPPITPRNSARSFWFAFCRGLGYGLARLVMGVLRRG